MSIASQKLELGLLAATGLEPVTPIASHKQDQGLFVAAALVLINQIASQMLVQDQLVATAFTPISNQMLSYNLLVAAVLELISFARLTELKQVYS